MARGVRTKRNGRVCARYSSPGINFIITNSVLMGERVPAQPGRTPVRDNYVDTIHHGSFDRVPFSTPRS